jgi:gliding motility-associated lipoprotein GldH
MRRTLAIIVAALLLYACDEQRLFENYKDFDDNIWVVKDQPAFDFTITDTQQPYNIYCNLRNAESYPFADFRFTYYLSDTTGALLDKKLRIHDLFNRKSGEPYGESGLGDIYDHQFLLLKNYKFNHAGKYTVRFEQFMRRDTLPGILAVGLRVERAEKP